MNKEIKKSIEKAIKDLGLSEKQLDIISTKNLEKLAIAAHTTLYNVMWYLRFER